MVKQCLNIFCLFSMMIKSYKCPISGQLKFSPGLDLHAHNRNKVDKLQVIQTNDAMVNII